MDSFESTPSALKIVKTFGLESMLLKFRKVKFLHSERKEQQ